MVFFLGQETAGNSWLWENYRIHEGYFSVETDLLYFRDGQSNFLSAGLDIASWAPEKAAKFLLEMRADPEVKLAMWEGNSVEATVVEFLQECLRHSKAIWSKDKSVGIRPHSKPCWPTTWCGTKLSICSGSLHCLALLLSSFLL